MEKVNHRKSVSKMQIKKPQPIQIQNVNALSMLLFWINIQVNVVHVNVVVVNIDVMNVVIELTDLWLINKHYNYHLIHLN